MGQEKEENSDRRETDSCTNPSPPDHVSDLTFVPVCLLRSFLGGASAVLAKGKCTCALRDGLQPPEKKFGLQQHQVVTATKELNVQTFCRAFSCVLLLPWLSDRSVCIAAFLLSTLLFNTLLHVCLHAS